VGPFGRSALDCAYLLEAIAGHDPHDATSLDRPVPNYRAACARGLEGLRIGFAEDWFVPLEDPVYDCLWKARDVLASDAVEIELPHTKFGIAAYYIIATAEASSNLARYDGVRYGLRTAGDSLAAMYAKTRAAGFGAEVKRRIILGTYALRSGYYDAYYLRAQKVRTLIKRDFERAFERCDVLVAPTAPSTAFKLGEKISDPLQMYMSDVYTIPINLAGLPAMSIPCGFVDGLPVGLQLIAPPLQEERLFAVAGAYQRATDWHTRRPR
jgi:aspartyl-tRNA(Asn)/glutamyl-tRNA(Gln) amidotransferase subunit A